MLYVDGEYVGPVSTSCLAAFHIRGLQTYVVGLVGSSLVTLAVSCILNFGFVGLVCIYLYVEPVSLQLLYEATSTQHNDILFSLDHQFREERCPRRLSGAKKIQPLLYEILNSNKDSTIK